MLPESYCWLNHRQRHISMFVQLCCFRGYKNLSCVQAFGDHPNIVKLLNVTRAQNDKDIYLIFEYMGEFSSCAFCSLQ